MGHTSVSKQKDRKKTVIRPEVDSNGYPIDKKTIKFLLSNGVGNLFTFVHFRVITLGLR